MPIWATVKVAQLQNVAASLGLTYYLLRLCDAVRPGNASLKLLSLGLLGMLPVYYRSFAFLRPEPLLAFLAILGAHLALRAVRADRPRSRDLLALGAVFGLLLLTRQQGLFVVVPTTALLLAGIYRRGGVRIALGGAAVVGVAVLAVAGWYYLHLHRAHGSPATFNRELHFSLANKPAEFYFGLGLPELFRAPLRPTFDRQFLSLMYADTWGDYYFYFLVRGTDSRNGLFVHDGALANAVTAGAPAWLRTNRDAMGRYLGRVNVVSLLPSAVLLGGVCLGLAALRRAVRSSGPDALPAQACGLAALVVTLSVAGYVPLVIAVPGGGTVKPTYLLHVFPFAALLGAELLLRTRARAPRVAACLLLLLLLVGLHNAGTYLTRYPTLRWSEANRL
jgi:hypothetical protein